MLGFFQDVEDIPLRILQATGPLEIITVFLPLLQIHPPKQHKFPCTVTNHVHDHMLSLHNVNDKMTPLYSKVSYDPKGLAPCIIALQSRCSIKMPSFMQ